MRRSNKKGGKNEAAAGALDSYPSSYELQNKKKPEELAGTRNGQMLELETVCKYR